MLSSLYSGISGLQANSNAISVVGNNIANSNTIGFKSSSTTFADLLYQSISSGSGTSQVGRGTTVSTVSTNFAQGSFQTTESATDLAIGGDGFFIVKAGNSQTAYYTRAGQFQFDKEGYLTNGSGYVLQGRAIDTATNTPTGVYRDIVVSQGLSQPQATSSIGMAVNLQYTSTQTGAPWAVGSTIDPDDANYSSSLTVYDSLGQSHIVDVGFRYNGVDAGGNSLWQWAAVAADSNTAIEAGNLGQLAFNSNGILLDTPPSHSTDGTLTFAFPGTAAQSVNIDFGSRTGGGASTQYQSASTTTFQTQNGYAPGELESITVSEDGTMSGHYSNGQILNLFQITLANFNNPNGLRKEGGNLYTETVQSGVAYTNSPGSGALGGISANSLEQSNVDLATEFVNLITCQRGYQANSRVITTTDQMLDELMNLKR
jgi:flagellar hook protein FlgE